MEPLIYPNWKKKMIINNTKRYGFQFMGSEFTNIYYTFFLFALSSFHIFLTNSLFFFGRVVAAKTLTDREFS